MEDFIMWFVFVIARNDSDEAISSSSRGLLRREEPLLAMT